MKVLPLCSATLLALCSTLIAEEFRGPLPEAQRELIQTLASNHRKLVRKVEKTETGYKATTTSEDPQLAKALKDHVAYMKKRLGSGAMVRRWDPAFREMAAYHDKLETEIKILETGIAVEVRGTTPEAILVARNHGRVVSGFVEKGPEAVQREHEKALDR